MISIDALKEKISGTIGKNHKDLEKELDFNWYLETKDDFLTGKRVDHNKLVEAFLEFNNNRSLLVVQFLNGDVKGVQEMNLDQIKNNLYLLVENKGIFSDNSDGELVTSYGFVCDEYLAEVMQGIIFFSGKEEWVKHFAKTLQKSELDYHESSPIKFYDSVDIKEEVQKMLF